MAILTLRIRASYSVLVIEAFERLCEEKHPSTGEVCHGSGTHAGPHSYGSVLAHSVVRWPNKRTSQLPEYGKWHGEKQRP